MKNYPGSKAGHGSFQQIMNEIPEISSLVILFGGHCPIANYFIGKVPVTIIEADPVVVHGYWQQKTHASMAEVVQGDCMTWLRRHYRRLDIKCLIYADPPYLFRTRNSGARLYTHEFGEEEQHEALLEFLKTIPSMVAISGYNSSLYEMHLGSWRKKSWQVRTHRRTVQETLWMNYERPEKLYTYDYLGRDRTERQRIRRKIMRWKSKLATLDPQERNAILNELQ